MTPRADVDLDSRVARLETSLASIERTQGAIVGSIERLSGEFQAARRPQWQLLLGLATIIIALGTAAGSIIMLAQRGAIAPIDARVSGLEALAVARDGRLDRVQVRVEEEARRLTEIGEKFREVETQFGALSNYSNMGDAELERLIAALWRRSYSEDLPRNGVRPTVGTN